MRKTLLNVIARGAALALAPDYMALAPAYAAEPLFDAVFSDHMVLQRDQPVALWGEAAPGDAVTVTFAGDTKTVEADAEGKWRAEFPARGAGGPFQIDARTGKSNRATLRDVLTGDVFLCSGQSNMAWPVSQTLNPQAEIADATDPSIRLLQIGRETAPAPLGAFKSPIAWEVASPETVPDFSALCYFFARELKRFENVPMGLIDSSWGGSQIEAWISAAALSAVEPLAADLVLLDLYASDPAAAQAAFAEEWEAWHRGAAPDAPTPWENPGEGWKAAPEPLASWKKWSDPALAEHNGMVWFRKTVELNNDPGPATLVLGAVDEVDMAWVNGVFVGGEFGWGTERRYDVGEGVFRAGENEIIVNVLSSWGDAGMTGPAETMTIKPQRGPAISIGAGWEYKLVPLSIGMPPRTPWQSISGLTGLYNAMIAPLGEIGLKGALWYQGESNAGRAGEYEELLRLMMNDWRAQFGEGLPFFIVQLPDFGAHAAAPVESGWAELRDAQRRAVAADPGAALVVTIDVGEPTDIHPPHKRPVAARAARLARTLIYGDTSTAPTPAPLRAYRKGKSVFIDFATLDSNAVVMGAAAPIAFEVCGAEPGSCAYAEAALDGARIRLSAPKGVTPSRVRYCWADAPICNLYDGAGIPVTPFELPVE
jgi:sialate O-acetylesterase